MFYISTPTDSLLLYTHMHVQVCGRPHEVRMSVKAWAGISLDPSCGSHYFTSVMATDSTRPSWPGQLIWVPSPDTNGINHQSGTQDWHFNPEWVFWESKGGDAFALVFVCVYCCTFEALVIFLYIWLQTQLVSVSCQQTHGITSWGSIRFGNGKNVSVAVLDAQHQGQRRSG